MTRFAPLVLLAACALAAVGLSGCGGAEGYITTGNNSDPITGHWMVGAQSSSLTGPRAATAVYGNLSFVITVAGLKTWSGVAGDSNGSTFSPGSGSWVRSGDVYSVSNSAAQTGTFGWSGDDLYSFTLVGGNPAYLWWTKQ